MSIDSDILLGLVKRLIKMRSSNLKVLITSATLDGTKVSEFFSNCPVLTVPGKLFPVEILYSSERPTSYLDACLNKALSMCLNFDPYSTIISLPRCNSKLLLINCCQPVFSHDS